MIQYNISIYPKQHIYAVEITFTAKKPTHELKLPTWIPGSYMIREFSKNMVDISIKSNKQLSTIKQINKNTWQISGLTENQTVAVLYNIYANDFGIRTAYLDENRAYFNPTSLCLYIVGEKNHNHIIKFGNIPQNWQIATGLKPIDNHIYQASSYDDLIDHPFEIAPLNVLDFEVKGILHKIALSGIINENLDKQRLIRDVAKICTTQAELFGGELPFSNYVFYSI